jgi:hypothetical protein
VFNSRATRNESGSIGGAALRVKKYELRIWDWGLRIFIEWRMFCDLSRCFVSFRGSVFVRLPKAIHEMTRNDAISF